MPEPRADRGDREHALEIVKQCDEVCHAGVSVVLSRRSGDAAARARGHPCDGVQPLPARGLNFVMASAVSVLGLGNMGSALAFALLDADHEVTVWNRTAAKAEPLTARGARAALTAADAVVASPLTVACLARYEHVRESLATTAKNGGLAGRTLANLSSGTPEEAEEMQRWVLACGGAYLDGGIPVTPSVIGRPDTGLVYSGPSATWREHAAALRALGGASGHVGEGIGEANVLSLAIPGAFYNLAYHAFFEAAAYAAHRGVAPEALRSLTRTAIRLLEEVLDDTFTAIERDDYENDQATLWVNYDAMVMVRDAIRREGQRATMTGAVVDVLARGVEAGYSDRGSAALLPLLRDGG